MRTLSTRGFPSGFDSVIQDQIEAHFADFFIFSNESRADIHLDFDFTPDRKNIPGKFKVLILWEPESVLPWQYSSKILKKFDLVIPASPWRARSLGLNNFIFHPCALQKYTFDESKRNMSIAMVNASKFSANGKSLYGFRRRASKYLYESQVGYDLFGQNWNMSKLKELRERLWSIRKEIQARKIPNFIEAFSYFNYKYPEYKGGIEDKYQTLSRYKFSLVIENEADWITEKIFDAISAGTVPIYFGPSLAEFPILDNCTISLPINFESLEKIKTKEIQSKYQAKKEFLDSLTFQEPEWAVFSPTVNINKMLKIIKQNYPTN
jgi:hypothetical protein